MKDHLQAIRNAAELLVNEAVRQGLVLTIEQRPLLPLAMGHYTTEVSVREARHTPATQQPQVVESQKASETVCNEPCVSGVRVEEPQAEAVPMPGDQIFRIARRLAPKVIDGMVYVPEWIVPLVRAVEESHGIVGEKGGA